MTKKISQREARRLRKRVEQLEREVLHSHEMYVAVENMRQRTADRADRADAHANALRDALEPFVPKEYIERGSCSCGNPPETCSVERAIRVLAAHPAASLAAHDAEVLERAAVVCDVWAGTCADIQRDAEERWDYAREAEADAMGATAEELAAAIRALAAQAQEVKP